MPSNQNSTPADDARRVYAGLSANDRAAKRREALIEAATHLIGTHGYQGTTVRAVCREAGLSERYFYESFSSRGQILSVVYDGLVIEARERVLGEIAHLGPDSDAEQVIDAAVRAFMNFAVEKRHRANILFIDVFGVTTDRQVLEITTSASFNLLIDELLSALTGGRYHPLYKYFVVGVVGFISRNLALWNLEGASQPPDVLIEACVMAVTSMFREVLGVLEIDGSPLTDPARYVEDVAALYSADKFARDSLER